MNHSIVIARNLGIEKHQRKQTHAMLEDFLIDLLNLYGLNTSDVLNLALESYLISEGYLTPDTLEFIKNISKLDKMIKEVGLSEILSD